MSGEPKTLTLEPITLEVAIAEAHKHEWVIHLHHDGFVEIETFSLDGLAYEQGYATAPSATLGVPVVARDEAAELRAAVKEWADAKQAFDDADLAWANAIDAGADVHGYKAAWERALNRERDAEAVLRRLAGGESER